MLHSTYSATAEEEIHSDSQTRILFQKQGMIRPLWQSICCCQTASTQKLSLPWTWQVAGLCCIDHMTPSSSTYLPSIHTTMTGFAQSSVDTI